MRKSEFIEYVRKPELLNCDKTSELQELTKNYPWFQSAHILLCKNLKVCENMGFEKQLRLTAAYSGDRVRLHQLIMETPTLQAEVEEKTKVVKETESPASAAIPKEEPSAAKVDEQPSKEKTQYPEEDFLEKQILSHAISNSNLLDEEPEVENDAEFIPERITFSKLSLLEKEHEEEEYEDDYADEQVDTQTEQEFNKKETHSFSDWLHHFDDPADEQKQELKEEGKKESLMPSRSKASFYNPTEMAKLSVKEDDDLITETLAKIYAQQGNVEKAIKSYIKLSLKYPEKKVYFASRILELEKEL